MICGGCNLADCETFEEPCGCECHDDPDPNDEIDAAKTQADAYWRALRRIANGEAEPAQIARDALGEEP